MMRMHKLFAVTLLIGTVAVIGLWAAGGTESGGGQESIILRVSEVNPEQDPVTQALYYFAERVDEASGGRIDVRIFPSAQLGGQADAIQGLQTGSIDITRTAPANLIDFGVEKMGVFSLPYIFADSDHAWRVIQSDVAEEVLASIEEADSGMVGLTFMLASPRNFFFTERAVRRLSDMEGLKIRVQPAEIYIDMIEALGASPTPIAFSELYSALQSGVVDAAENPIKGYFNQSYYEVAPYFTFSGHLLEPTPMIISKITWDNLSEEDREILRVAAQQAGEFYRNGLIETEEQYIAELEELQVEFVEVEDPDAWYSAVRPMYSVYGRGNEDLIDRIETLR